MTRIVGYFAVQYWPSLCNATPRSDRERASTIGYFAAFLWLGNANRLLRIREIIAPKTYAWSQVKTIYWHIRKFSIQRLAATYGDSKKRTTNREYQKVNIPKAWYVYTIILSNGTILCTQINANFLFLCKYSNGRAYRFFFKQ